MKLILKDGQELIITRANDTYSYEGYKDGLGNDMNRNIVATISIFNSDKSLNTIKDMITDENRTGFKIIYGNTQKDYTGMKIESISEEISNERSVINISLATDKTIAPNLACLYCYQGHKGKNRMSFETAKKFFDLVVSGEKGFKSYINPEKSPGLVVDFIGGEPFLEIELIDQICTYIMDKLIELDHPWAMKTMFSICSNGVLYRDEKVQAFLRKWANRLSFSVTIDGNKELHDSCRVFPDGGPSYDIAVDAASDWMKRGNHMGSKITIAPGNISFLYDAIKHMVDGQWF